MEQVLVVGESDEMARLADLGVREAEPDGKAQRVGDHADHEEQGRRQKQLRNYKPPRANTARDNAPLSP